MGALEAFVQAFDASEANAAAQPAWRAQARRQAREALLRSGLPTRHTEDWKYTSLRALDALDLATAAPTPLTALTAPTEPLALEALRDAGALLVGAGPRLVFVDGVFDTALSRVNDLPPGVSLAPWGAKPSHSCAGAGAVLDAAARGGAFDAINRMFARDGLVLDLADGACLDAPVVIITLQTRAGAAHVRHALRLGQGAAAQVIEQHIGLARAPAYLVTSVTQATLGRGAKLAHVRLQEDSGAAIHVSQLHAAQSEDSQLDAQALVLGARLSRQEFHIEHEAPGCSTALRGLSTLAGTQHGDVHVQIDHREPRGTSRTHVRGVFDEAAHGVFTGRVNVHARAQKADAGMVNRNLLLSPQAEADTRPQLQIDADDVLCSHGAAVGPLDDEALFYVLSRGIAPHDARALLVQAFMAEALPDIGWAPLRAHVQAHLVARWSLAPGLEGEAS